LHAEGCRVRLHDDDNVAQVSPLIIEDKALGHITKYEKVSGKLEAALRFVKLQQATVRGTSYKRTGSVRRGAGWAVAPFQQAQSRSQLATAVGYVKTEACLIRIDVIGGTQRNFELLADQAELVARRQLTSEAQVLRVQLPEGRGDILLPTPRGFVVDAATGQLRDTTRHVLFQPSGFAGADVSHGLQAAAGSARLTRQGTDGDITWVEAEVPNDPQGVMSALFLGRQVGAHTLVLSVGFRSDKNTQKEVLQRFASAMQRAKFNPSVRSIDVEQANRFLAGRKFSRTLNTRRTSSLIVLSFCGDGTTRESDGFSGGRADVRSNFSVNASSSNRRRWRVWQNEQGQLMLTLGQTSKRLKVMRSAIKVGGSAYWEKGRSGC